MRKVRTCKKGHDISILGRTPGGRCRECVRGYKRREAARKAELLTTALASRPTGDACDGEILRSSKILHLIDKLDNSGLLSWEREDIKKQIESLTQKP